MSAFGQRILVVEDEQVARENLMHVLGKAGFQAFSAATGQQAVEFLRRESVDLVLTDFKMKGLDGLGVLSFVKARSPDTEVIMLTGYATVETAVEAMRQGAFHFLSKPYNLDELRLLVARALEKRQLRLEVEDLRRKLSETPGHRLVGRSPAMREVQAMIERIAPFESTVLIQGETGTGKELAAQMIHERSPRRRGPFLAVNCAAFHEDLLANEFFGHEKDAFTGARTAKPGIMEAARGGTLFLDEVGDMSAAMQVKLLRALQERRILRVGGITPIEVDFRLVAAGNKDLRLEVQAGAFRQDLFYRLNVISLRLPPLSEREGDVELLSNFFVSRFNQSMGKAIKGVSETAMDLLAAYAFPGNVRELENIIESACVMCNGPLIERGHLPPDIQAAELLLTRQEPVFETGTLAEAERAHIERALERAGGNKTVAAKLLGIDRATLWRKLK